MNLKPGAHIHLMGICGTAMASLAGLLKQRGYKVTGSDTQAYPPMSTQLEELGIKIKIGYQAENLEPRPDLVIVGNVVMRKYEEATALLESDIPYTSLPKAMADFVIEDRESIVLAGTHGKTTSTSLMAWIAEKLEMKPGFLIGGIPKNFARSFQNPQGSHFVIEGDEYDTAFFDKVPKFIHYKPRHVVLTSVEFDHADIYKDLDDVKKAFIQLLELIPAEGHLAYAADDKNIESLIGIGSCKKRSYGLDSGDYQAQSLQFKEGKMFFDFIYEGKNQGSVTLPMIGEYNLKNALGVLSLCHMMGWEMKKSIEALASFQGVKRRQEVLGCPSGVTLIEDFAHHPTAVKETIKAVHQAYPGQKVFSVFEPRSATTRRKIFQREYVDAFVNSSEVILKTPYDQSSIEENDRFSTEELCKDLQDQGVNAREYTSVEEIIKTLTEQAKKGDVILIMSNGGFDGIYQKLINEL